MAHGWAMPDDDFMPLSFSPYSYFLLIWPDVQQGPNHVPGVSIA